jgi:hypothetical protein
MMAEHDDWMATGVLVLLGQERPAERGLDSEARDVVTLVVTVALLAIVALIASSVPARRATRLDPTTALRIE